MDLDLDQIEKKNVGSGICHTILSGEESTKLAQKHLHSMYTSRTQLTTIQTISIHDSSGALGPVCFQEPSRPALASLLFHGEGEPGV
eukprot:1158418-Pelagomonas_calceolata.AAC.13